ncbi:MAG: V-type ATP synthase subunit I [Clostridiaceae bacterium]|jgi:V/A-type H+-transporting ATPase subunit I|nr:V-type ATP synthase subunit I [Clostridiaceae bacterium]
MAVIKMNKIAVLGLNEERSELLKTLQKFGVLEIDLKEPEEGLGDKTYNLSVLSDLSIIDDCISELDGAIDILSRFAPVKKPLFSARRVISEAEYNEVIKQKDNMINQARQIRSTYNDLEKLKLEENNLNSQLASVEPWLNLDIPLEMTETRHAFFYTGTLPARIDINALKDSLKTEIPESELLPVKIDSDIYYIVVFGMKDAEAEILEHLRKWEFSRISFREGQGTAKERRLQLKNELKALDEEREKKKSLIIELASKRNELETLSDAFRTERTEVEAKSRLLTTDRTFLLTGWVYAEHSEKIEEYINKHFYCAVSIEEPAENEEFPVQYKNGPIIEAINPVVEMYGVPSSLEIDPRGITLPFYAFIFGLMLGDGGYGLILALGAGIALKKFRMEDKTRQFVKLLFICGLATILAGFLYGSWFGISSLTKYALWIVPTENPELMMSYAILIGIIHMFTGIVMKGLNSIRRGKVFDAICDSAFLIIMYSGLVMSLLPFAPGLSITNDSPIVQAGYKVFIAGIALVLITGGRKSKNIFGKIFGGLPGLYDIVSFFSDCLSYTRILALGLASALIADIANNLALSFGGFIVLRVIFATLILIFAHTLNFGLNILSAYVHSCRLQFLEFYGKFLEGGGEAFEAYKAKTRYIVVNYESLKLFNSGVKSGI